MSTDLTIECPWFAGAPSSDALFSLVIGIIVYPVGSPLITHP